MNVAQFAAKKIKKTRVALGLSQTELARRAKVTRITVWAAENNRKQVKTETLNKIATALGVTVADLFTDPTKVPQ